MAKDDKTMNDYIKQLEQEAARAEADKKAIQQEFEKVCQEELTPEVIREKIKNEILPEAWIALKTLISHAESESIRASLIKWAFEFASRPLPDGANNSADAELTKLLSAIKS